MRAVPHASAPVFFDAHCHLHRFADPGATLRRAVDRGVRHFVVDGTSPSDWDDVLALARDHPDAVLPAIGLHPWFLSEAPPDWPDRLRGHLEHHPNLGVGEIGLDRTRRSPKPREQLDPLRLQLDLAAEFHRPATLHCVGCWGRLLEELQAARHRHGRSSPTLVIHGSRPDPREITRFIDLGCLFSIGRTDPEDREDAAAIAAIPDDHLLLESDASPDNGIESERLPTFATVVARIRGTTPPDLAKSTAANAARVFLATSETGEPGRDR